MTRPGRLVILALLVGAPAVSVAQAQQAGEQARRAQVLASFEGGRITVGDLEDAIARKAPHVRERLQQREPRVQLLRDMVDYELLVREARRRGYGSHFRVTDAMAVESVNLLEAEVRGAITPDAIPQADVEAYFDSNRERLGRGELRRASFVRFESREQAEAFRRQAAAMGLDAFRREASRRDPNGRGGELGYVDADGYPVGNRAAPTLDADLVRAAFGLAAVGDTSQPIPYQGGFIIMRLTALDEAWGTSLKEVEPAVREQLAKQRQDAAMDALRERLAREHPSHTEPRLLERVELDTAQPDIPMGFPAAPRDPTAPDVVVEPDDA